MELHDRFRNALRRGDLVSPGSSVLVALSGGLDSVVLLHLFRSLQAEMSLTLRAAHFDHRMREDSTEDADWVAALCHDWDIGLQRGLAPVAPRNEAEARTLRYRFLEECVRETPAQVATAHHADDQAETVLFRLLRGTGLDGLAGIPRQRGRLIRPLLGFWRRELERYAAAHGLAWREDPSNLSRAHARNRIRLDLLPQLEAESPGARRALVHLSRAAARTRAAWDHALGDIEKRVILSEDTGIIELARPVLLEYHPEVRARLLRHWLARLAHAPGRAGTAVLETFINAAGSGSTLHLRGGLRAERDFQVIRLYKATAPNAATDQLLCIENAAPGGGETIVGGRRFRVRWSVGAAAEDGESAGFDPTDLRFPLALRAWRPGDRIRLPFGSKKLKKLFAEKRLGRDHRRAVPVLVDGQGEVLWVVGLARSADARPQAERSPLCITVSDGNAN
ncbi:MAG TPA: tRNA lysidine(34) synthetase TilS [Longimicrobiales bacterium]|nr:tRNA lysidine(34) synthetase TilS [Longimicrobiales bacterium]